MDEPVNMPTAEERERLHLVWCSLISRWVDKRNCPGCGHLVAITRPRVRQKRHEGLRWHTKCLEKAVANATLRSLGE